MIWKNLNNVGGFCCGKKRFPVRFKIGRQIPGTSNFAEVFKTELLCFQTPDYELPLQMLNLSQLCNNNRDAKIQFSVFNAKDKMINQVQHSINEIMDSGKEFHANAKSQLFLSDWDVFERPDLVDYLRSGWGISVVGAIDYTASNGDPNDRDSLHYLGRNNQYESAIYNVGGIIEPYDNDK